MKRVFSLFLIITAAFLAVAATSGEFESLSDEAAHKYTLPKHVGSEYATKFSDWSTEPMLHAMDVCGSRPFSNRYCDIIAVVAVDGHIRRLLFSPSDRYVGCVRKNLRLGAAAPRPPGDSWPVQIRLLDGLRPKPKPSDKPFIILSQGHVE